MSFHNIDATNLQIESLKLAKQIYDSGLRPTILIALWRGGTPIAMYIHEFFKHKGHNIDHIAIRTSSYEGQNQSREIQVHGLGYIVKRANADDSVLIVDDIFDSGRSVKKVLDTMKERMRLNTPTNIKIATLFYKPKNTKVDIKPDFHNIETDKWVVFPHELEDLSDENIKMLKGDHIYDLIK